jgi:redox-sensitive bicupin YhaK (pirin superfamily)
MNLLPPSITTQIIPRAHDLGGFSVRRALPAAARQMVGPFIFLDQMGPAAFAPGRGIDVRPHPHIGLSTLTYLYEGAILHRDSLGIRQPITPGAVNWMTAGSGIVHSEREEAEAMAAPRRMHGLQAWLALPRAEEERAPSFHHHPAASLPVLGDTGFRIHLVAGTGWGAAAPVETHHPTFYADATLAPYAALPLDPEHEERAACISEGAVRIGGQDFPEAQLLVFRAGDAITLQAGEAGARIMLLGGAAMDGPRFIWWNFVSSRRERIEDAKADWAARRFPGVSGDMEEFIPLPDKR